ncbi:GPP34 family phosphoprotein [Kibdelosporangium persicum]|uniref:Golgi phosphoprotein 3 GPP34 n=1 Tax=Kibdelosporangium persicum TaxID=2698649 RepID=A0ABX2F9C1_9PSEU|nr:GPP34 family phosphoprotein [Kibdelosporangium persicum]NRN67960.1 Golgi phosphoprotein 3 GPP34 [Kibdelosporangium persicum]
MAVPHSLPQRVFLLAYDPDKGRVGPGTNLGAMLRAAALADLYRGGLLTDERGRAVIGVRHPCDDPVFDALLEEIAGSKPHTWQSWIGHRRHAAVGAVRRQLSDGGWVHLQPHKILGLFPSTKVTVRDPRVRDELLGRVHTALHKPIGGIDPADAALVAIIAVGDLRLVLDRKTTRANKQRIQELTKLSGPIGPALHKAIQAAAVGEI